MSSIATNYQIHTSPLPDEHILGTMARHHLYSGFTTYKAAVSPLSDDYTKQVPYMVDRPLYRDIYERFGSKASYEVFLQRHTLYNYYSSFLSKADRTADEGKYCTPDKINLVNHSCEWRFCMSCMEEDLEHQGCAYYHLAHQVPGMLFCTKHGEFLKVPCEACYKHSRSIDKVGVPYQSTCNACSSPYKTLDGYMDEDLFWLMDTSVKLTHGIYEPLNLTTLQKAYAHHLGLEFERHTLSVHDRNRIVEVQRALDNHFKPQLFERLFTLKMTSLNRKFSGLSAFELTYHDKLKLPVAHLLMIRMLFGDWDNIPLVLE